MKALIVNSPTMDRVSLDKSRFAQMTQALSSGGVQAEYVPLYSKQGIINELSNHQYDIAFSSSYYLWNQFDEKINTHLVFEELQLPFIGSSSKTLELVLSKSSLKNLWRSNNISTPDFFVLSKADFEFQELESLQEICDFPYILKPDNEGNSRGICDASVVFNPDQLRNRLSELFSVYDSILIEKYLSGEDNFREFTVAMIGNGEHRLLMPVRIILKNKRKVRVVTTEDKDNHNTQAIPITDPLLKQRVIDFANCAFEAAGVCDYARCDIILLGTELYAIEINGQPMVPDKWFESCAAGVGLNSVQYLIAIFLAGIIRNAKIGNTRMDIPPQMGKILPREIFTLLSK